MPETSEHTSGSRELTEGSAGPVGEVAAGPATAREATGRIPAPVLAVAAMFTVQLGVAWSTSLFEPLGVAGATSLRLLVAAAVLLVIARPSLAGRTPRQLATVALLGLASGGMTLLFAASIQRIPMGVTSTIEFLGPLGVALASSRRLSHAGWAALAGLGVVLLCLADDGLNGADGLDTVGLALAGAAALCWAVYIVFTRRVGQVFDGFQGLAVSISVAAVAVLPVGGASAWHGLVDSDRTLWLLAQGVGVALLFPVATYMLEMTALRRLSSRVFGVLTSLEPGVAVLIGFLVLGQSLAPVQLAGLGCVVLASIAATLGDRGEE
ncbi:EamA family transporter [Kitasatospora sp. NPDC096128]|uniref:EamA family transporter n=1 Tax=Kitasatospora sp. NPDC096128 TaxID=3155547 RepID=UPI00332523C9